MTNEELWYRANKDKPLPANLFDPDTVTNGKAIVSVMPPLEPGDQGEVIYATSMGKAVSDYIPVEAGKTYTCNLPSTGDYRSAVFDTNKSPLSVIDNDSSGTTTFEIPENGAYVQITVLVYTASSVVFSEPPGRMTAGMKKYLGWKYGVCRNAGVPAPQVPDLLPIENDTPMT